MIGELKCTYADLPQKVFYAETTPFGVFNHTVIQWFN